jgi:hypothetical protein
MADTGTPESARWGFFLNLGAGGIHKDFDSTLHAARTGEFGISRAPGAWRYGLGVSLGSFAMRPA